MESQEGEWTRAAEAAERGLKMLPENQRLLFLAGYSRSRLGRELKTGLHTDRGNRELAQARVWLEKAIEAAGSGDIGDRSVRSDIYRALVLNCESAGDVKRMKSYFEKWSSEYPEDDAVRFEGRRLQAKLGPTA
jgi:hypothetical protein